MNIERRAEQPKIEKEKSKEGKTPEEITEAEIESLGRENPERLKEFGKEVKIDIREKKKEIRILRKTLRDLGGDFEEDIALARSERLKRLEQEMNYKEKKLKEAKTKLAQLKQTKEKLQKYD